MRISIAMCTYNGAKHLQRQLDGFASQTFPPYELVVCDDGSVDTTLAILESFAEKARFPVRIFKNNQNLGSTQNFEKAIGLCEGELIALSDQDDEWYADKLAAMHQLFQEYPHALAAFSDADIIDEESHRTGRKLWRSLFFVPPAKTSAVNPGLVYSLFKFDYIATGATMVFRAELRPQIIPIPESWVHDAWISWITALRGGLAAVATATIGYRVHKRQQIGVAPPRLKDRITLIREKNASLYELIALRLQILRRYIEQRENDIQLAQYLPLLNKKIRHLEGRASSKIGMQRRLFWILSSWQDYQQFSRGLVAMIADAFFVGRK
jgi:glycosyltransferase involved in cell wall biosynthesis